ncbi:hypothetical protein ACVDG8_015990 [Mesorhizobium sp. ORM8.1]
MAAVRRPTARRIRPARRRGGWSTATGGGNIFRRQRHIRHGRYEFGFDLGDLGLHRLAPADGSFNRDVRIGLQHAVERGKGGSIDPLAKRPVLGIAFLEGIADRFLDGVQASSLCAFALIVSRSRPINQRAAGDLAGASRAISAFFA